jgi:phytoene dehydrogenase-like protein
LDRPLYYSVHSAAARLAPDGVAVVHLMKYAGKERSPAQEVKQELEGLLERIQPGWRRYTVLRRFLPGLTVAHDLPRADGGGLPGRPGVLVEGRPHVLVAGDWVGGRGMLADASAASAEEAAGVILAALGRSPVVPSRSLSHAGS